MNIYQRTVKNMAIYEYKCNTCNHKFEVLQKMDDLPLKKCPKCGRKIRKLISPVAIIFKGSGWTKKGRGN